MPFWTDFRPCLVWIHLFYPFKPRCIRTGSELLCSFLITSKLLQHPLTPTSEIPSFCNTLPYLRSRCFILGSFPEWWENYDRFRIVFKSKISVPFIDGFISLCLPIISSWLLLTRWLRCLVHIFLFVKFTLCISEVGFRWFAPVSHFIININIFHRIIYTYW